MDGSGTPILQTRGTPDDASETVSARWLDALQRIGRHYRLPASPQGAMQAWHAHGDVPEQDRIDVLAQAFGLTARHVDPATITVSD